MYLQNMFLWNSNEHTHTHRCVFVVVSMTWDDSIRLHVQIIHCTHRYTCTHTFQTNVQIQWQHCYMYMRSVALLCSSLHWNCVSHIRSHRNSYDFGINACYHRTTETPIRILFLFIHFDCFRSQFHSSPHRNADFKRNQAIYRDQMCARFEKPNSKDQQHKPLESILQCSAFSSKYVRYLKSTVWKILLTVLDILSLSK